jgi:hypothetical protein
MAQAGVRADMLSKPAELRLLRWSQSFFAFTSLTGDRYGTVAYGTAAAGEPNAFRPIEPHGLCG